MGSPLFGISLFVRSGLLLIRVVIISAYKQFPRPQAQPGTPSPHSTRGSFAPCTRRRWALPGRCRMGRNHRKVRNLSLISHILSTRRFRTHSFPPATPPLRPRFRAILLLPSCSIRHRGLAIQDLATPHPLRLMIIGHGYVHVGKNFRGPPITPLLP